MANKTNVTSTSAMNKKSELIDDAQTETVDEHFRILFEDNGAIDSEPSELSVEDLPEWYDDELFRGKLEKPPLKEREIDYRGQNYYQDNMLAMGLMAMIGLMSVLVIPTILKVLIFTKRSGTPCTAFTRYLETILHIHTLYLADIKDKNSDWWRSLNTIRWKHATNSRRSSNAQIGAITHRDMALTQFGFIGYALLAADKLSLTNQPKERESLNHFWRVVGHLLGISDRMNICRKNEAETTQLCKRLLDDVYAKYMKTGDANLFHMVSMFIDGLWSIDFTLDNDALLYLWYELSGLKYEKPLATYSWLNMQYRSSVLYLLGLPYIGYLVRIAFNCYLRINYAIVRHYPIVAWLRFGKARSTINVYPKLL